MPDLPEGLPSSVDAHRLASRLLAVSLLLFAVPTVMQAAVDVHRVAWWWNLPLGLATVLVLVLALTGRDRWAARLLVLVSVTGALSVPAAVDRPLGSTTWVALLVPLTVAACALVARRTVLCAAAVAAVLGSGYVAYSRMVPNPSEPPALRLLVLIAIASVALALIRSLEHAQSRVLAAQDAAVEEYVAARTSEATVRAEQAWDAYLHDEVVAALLLLADGPADLARDTAARLIAGESRALESVGVPTPWVRDGSLDSVLRHRPDAEIVVDVPADMGALPAEVRRAVLEALSEALRNVDRHAYGPGGQGPSRVEVRIRPEEVWVRVSDDGCGFDPRGVGGASMGITLSIQGRMDAVGGWSRIVSEPGRGTLVELGWSGSAEERE